MGDTTLTLVINCAFGGFSISDTALNEYCKITGKCSDVRKYDIPRDDPVLVDIVRRLGKLANGKYAHLKLVEIPGDIEWDIEEYDGLERIVEKHRVWH